MQSHPRRTLRGLKSSAASSVRPQRDAVARDASPFTRAFVRADRDSGRLRVFARTLDRERIVEALALSSGMTVADIGAGTGGSLAVLDFERIPGESRDWVLGHMRAGKEVFRREIESAGFQFEREVPVEGLEENYVLRFPRP